MEIVGKSEAPALILSSCRSDAERSHLHQLGLAHGITQWIEDFRTKTSAPRQDDAVNHSLQATVGNKPLAIVQPIPTPPRPLKNSEV